MNQSDALSLPPATVPVAGRVFLSLLSRMAIGHLHVITPLGERLGFGVAGGLGAELQLKDWRACDAILSGGDIGFADAVRNGWVDSPDFTALLRLAIRNERELAPALSGSVLAWLWYGLRHRLRANTRSGSRRNIHAHYDIGNPFYACWLDATWSYSAALFEGDHDRDLEAAQAAKYQRIVDVLGLQPGMRVLEIGCGWGGFAEHAARQGIAVHGITISPAQLALAQRRIAAAGLQHLVDLELLDYRDLTGEYDAVVSIEMFEAVGERYWPRYFAGVRDRLRAGGCALIQSITIAETHFARYRAGSDFIREFIFPGGMLPSIERFSATAARRGLTTVEAFRFGPDYAETLRRWRAAFERERDAIVAQGFDEVFMRTWQLYLCYCEAGFDEGRTDVAQFLLRREP
ncbi:cyclopropane-fatty-acyl-phospholipid synthase family protein [Chitiniphilus purpureus]|uniref:Cyclopropane-fatty-acyl-phospholipid synthase family protein n=1 Tax=Chitiniphilus purpureus TaxID=2981137 RepID=A0ABY6DN92_9NEIS|nr:cyclopropane-fatty-acyl-phospholipid synthase family protein [Chitiniphilus sp. CD1]UXY15837.1 cyclopropane-fatty-acyl-phospholipid synthase family protein [Chitiniphilus sp. CD1]